MSRLLQPPLLRLASQQARLYNINAQERMCSLINRQTQALTCYNGLSQGLISSHHNLLWALTCYYELSQFIMGSHMLL